MMLQIKNKTRLVIMLHYVTHLYMKLHDVCGQTC